MKNLRNEETSEANTAKNKNKPTRREKRNNRQIRATEPLHVEEPPRKTAAAKKKGLAASAGNPVPRDAAEDAFRPQALSNSKTAEKNDPLILDAVLVDGISATILCAKGRNFQDDFSQYIQLIISSYQVLTRLDRGLQKFLSFSTYQYYAFVLLWRRLRFVLTEKGEGVNEYESLIRKLPPMSVPDELGHYLDGIGNITDYNDRPYYLAIQGELRRTLVHGLSGHYGKVDSVSHLLYETLPSPFVALFRVLQDIAQTRARQFNIDVSQDWDLPTELRPEGSYKPNRNLLGWDRSSHLTQEQLQMLTDAGLDVEFIVAEEVASLRYHTDTITNFDGLPILYPVLLQVSELLSGSKSSYNNHAPSLSTKGSVAQCGFVVRSPSDVSRSTSGRSLTPIYECEGTWHCYHQASIHMCSAGSIYRYRLQRKMHGVSDYLCYTGPAGGTVPQWADNADDVFTSVPPWNMPEFRTTMTSGKLLSISYSERIRKVAPK